MNSNPNRDTDGQYLLDLTVVLWFCATPLKAVLSRFLYIFDAQDLLELFSIAIIFTPLFLYMLTQRKIPTCNFFILSLFVVGLFFIVTLAMNPAYERWYSRETYGVWDTILKPDQGAIWVVLMVEISKSPKRFFKNIHTSAMLLFLYSFFQVYQSVQNGGWTYIDYQGVESLRPYNLEFGYTSTFIALVCFTAFIFNKKPSELLFAIIASCFVFMYGSRGPLICLIIFTLLMVLFFSSSIKNRAILLPCLLFLLIFLVSFGESSLYMIASWIQNAGIESRTITSFLDNQVFDDSGRSQIYTLAEQAILANPYGYGAFGDRPIIGPYYNWGYSHNIILEMLITFGVLFGTVFLILIVVANIGALLINRNNKVIISLLVISISMSSSLWVSDTFWGNIYFWMMLAILFRFALAKRKEN